MRSFYRILGLFFIVFLLIASFGGVQVCAEDKSPEKQNFHLDNIVKRGDFLNSSAVFQQTGKGRVAFLGGSITEMDGYRPMVCADLTRTFPKTEFTFLDAGISSTCSTTGAFRLFRDILSYGPLDLLFVEFAVNDNQDGFFSLTQSIRGMEGVIRQARAAAPKADIVMIFFANEPILDAYRAGTEADSIAAHRQVAERYGISTVNLAREVVEQIDAGTLTWQEYGGVHPAPRGNRLCADMIAALLDADEQLALQGEVPGDRPTEHPMPEPLDRFSYGGLTRESANNVTENNAAENNATNKEDGEISADQTTENSARDGFLSPETALLESGWHWGKPDWPTIPGELRGRFAEERLLCATTPEAKCVLAFSGPVLGAYLLAGPDAGILEYRIDGGPVQKIDLYHNYSAGLHYPRTVIFADELADGPHKIELTLSAEKNPRSTGTAARILQFCVAN